MRFGARTLLFPGLLLITGGLLVFTRAPVHGSYIEHVLPVMVLFGFGGGIAFPGLMTLAMSGASHEDAGLVSGLVNTTAEVGGALGLAVLATLSATRTHDAAAGGASNASALVSGYHLAFLVAAALMAASVVVSAVVLQQPAAPAEAGQGTEDELAYSEAA
jgi:MFS family permease